MKHNLPKQSFGTGIGKYINPQLFQQNAKQVEANNSKKRKENPNQQTQALEPEKKKPKKEKGFGDFSGF